MKKIAILILMLTVSIHANALGTEASQGAGTEASQGAGTETYDPRVDPDAYNPKVDANAYSDGAPKSSGDFSSGIKNSNSNPFKASSDGVPKLSLTGIVLWLAGLMNQIIYLIIGAALVSFLYGILKLSFVDGQKPEAREQARKFMFWGIVSLFVMMSVWGLVNILKVTLFGPGDLIIPRLK